MKRVTLQEAEELILKRRPIQLAEVMKRKHMADWAYEAIRQSKPGNPYPRGHGWAATERSHTHVVTQAGTPLCSFKQGASRPRQLKNPETTEDKDVAISWGLPFCHGCQERCSASFLL